MHGAVAEFMIAEHAATGNDHLELVGLVEVWPGDGARTLLDQEAIGCSASSAGGVSSGGKV